MRARFLAVNTAVLAVLYAGWRAGLFDEAPAFSQTEMILAAALVAYSLLAFGAAALQRWDACVHYANGIPIWGLFLTGIGVLSAVGSIGSSPDAAVQALKSIGFALLPNILGAALLAWVREIAWCCSGRRI